ncbi:MAG: winged helix-turn-helix domain-containing protein [Hyphomonadaceae bacterium]|nr:winged helix-turn-helix domain-containing protein [Hyphomonadaceae bacterium]
MIHEFEDCELDTDKVELRVCGVVVAIEPQVFELLRFLIERRDHVVTREEIIERVWKGRFVSDAAVSSRIKSARRAIGDDGRAQRVIKTVHGTGFRFVADIAPARARIANPTPESETPTPAPLTRPSIAVLPFRLVGVAEPGFPIAEALPDDLITELSRLHWLFVIARGSSFRFRGSTARLDRVRMELGVRYCLTGVVEIVGDRLIVSVELSDTASEGVLWAERFHGSVNAIHDIRAQISAAVAAALEIRIPLNEAQRAQLKSPDSLDAWSVYHLGLHHMFRFNRADNERAKTFFERVVTMEPGFARGYAGLSFTHFQDAFLRYGDHDQAATLAQRYASECLDRDPLDPFGHYSMGRSLWLHGDLERSVPWLEQANTLNPNYAHARYSKGLAEAVLGRAEAGLVSVDQAFALSPIDPLTYGMFGVRALSSIGLSRMPEAADWAERAANTAGAHALIEMIAVAANYLNGNGVKAEAWADSVRQKAPHLTSADFMAAFPFRNAVTQQRISDALGKFRF